jgi:hypothetical protein
MSTFHISFLFFILRKGLPAIADRQGRGRGWSKF